MSFSGGDTDAAQNLKVLVGFVQVADFNDGLAVLPVGVGVAHAVPPWRVGDILRVGAGDDSVKAAEGVRSTGLIRGRQRRRREKRRQGVAIWLLTGVFRQRRQWF